VFQEQKVLGVGVGAWASLFPGAASAASTSRYVNLFGRARKDFFCTRASHVFICTGNGDLIEFGMQLLKIAHNIYININSSLFGKVESNPLSGIRHFGRVEILNVFRSYTNH